MYVLFAFLCHFDEGEISASNSATIIAILCRASRKDCFFVEMINFTITLRNVTDAIRISHINQVNNKKAALKGAAFLLNYSL